LEARSTSDCSEEEEEEEEEEEGGGGGGEEVEECESYDNLHRRIKPVTCRFPIVLQFLNYPTLCQSPVSLLVCYYVSRWSDSVNQQFPFLVIKLLNHFKTVFFSLFSSCVAALDSTKYPALGEGNFSEPRLMSQVGRVREVVCA
jgi:hypothetical protein